MPLSFTERFRDSSGGKEMLFVDVGQDEATSTFTALSVGMHEVIFAGFLGWSAAASGAADMSVFLGYTTVSVQCDILGNPGTVIEQGVPMKVGSTKHLLLIGW